MAKLQIILPFILTFGVVILFVFGVLKSTEVYEVQPLSFPKENCMCKVASTEISRIICEKMETRRMCEHNFTFYTEEELQTSKQFVISKADMCDKHIDIVAVVYSRIQRFDRREVIRETWAKVARKHGIKVLFFIGISGNETIQSRIVKESLVFKDIIQSPFIDSYYNLTLKAFSVLNALNQWCPNVSFVIKSDEDVLVNVHKAIEVTEKHKSESLVSIGIPVLNKRIINPNNKYYVPKFVYNKDYPERPGGPLIIYSGDCIRALLSKCYKFNPFYMEDAYVYGVVAENVGIRFVPVWNIGFFRSMNEENVDFSDYIGIEGVNTEKMREVSNKLNSKHFNE